MASVIFTQLRSLHSHLSDPFGFTAALRDLHLAPEDLPQITREARLDGRGS